MIPSYQQYQQKTRLTSSPLTGDFGMMPLGLLINVGGYYQLSKIELTGSRLAEAG